MALVFSYIRFSTKAQEMGTSIKRQRDEIDRVLLREGWVIEEEISDLGKSAFKGHHLIDAAGLGGFANRVRSGLVPSGSILIVENIDRLSRREPIDVFNWMTEMTSLGLRIYFADGNRMFDAASLRGDQAIMAVMEVWWTSSRAHGESKRKSGVMQRVWRDKHVEAAKTGKVISKQAPLWLAVRHDKSGFDLIPERVEVVRSVFQWSIDGLSTRAIARLLNERGIPAWGPQNAQKSGQPGWSLTSIRRMISAHQVEGDYIPKTVEGTHQERDPNANLAEMPGRVADYYPRIIDADTVARARAALGARASGSRGNNRQTFNNLFSGLCRCSGCSGPMEFRKPWSRGRNGPETMRGYMNCSNSNLRRGCDRVEYFRYGTFEDAAIGAFLQYAMDDDSFHQGTAMRDRAIALAEADKLVRDLLEQQERGLDYLLSEPSKAVEGRLAKIEAKLARAEQEAKEARASLALAQGKVSPEGHRRRISEVADAINSSDVDERMIARSKVSQAIRGLVDVVWCDTKDKFKGKECSTLTVICVGGALNFKFENKGGLIATAGVMDDLEEGLGHAEGVGADDPGTRRRLEALYRRGMPNP